MWRENVVSYLLKQIWNLHTIFNFLKIALKHPCIFTHLENKKLKAKNRIQEVKKIVLRKLSVCF